MDITITKEQLESYGKKVLQYNILPEKVYHSFTDNILFLQFKFITIGIEKDGYCHS